MTNNSMDKDTKGEIRRRNQRMIDNAIGKRYQRGKLEDVIKEWVIIQWSKDTKGEIRRRNQRMTDNIMVKRYQREIRRRNQRMTDNTMVIRYQREH